MANAHDYFDILTDQIEISPANSQEELNASQVIADLMRGHGLDTKVEEFDASSFGKLPTSVLFIVMFVGILISGFGGYILSLIGGLLALFSAGVLVLDTMGKNILEGVGSSIRSQNVIAKHDASGPLVAKGVRPIVVVAHYDSPRESFLYSTGISKVLPLFCRLLPWCVIVTGVGAFIQILGFLPNGLRAVFWVLGLLAAIPPLVLAIGTIAEHFANCSLGANDNKAGVAALLGVMETIFPSDGAPYIASRIVQSRNERELAEEPVRHGEEAIRSLGILPDSCEIEYVDEPEDSDELSPAGVTSDISEATSSIDSFDGAASQTNVADVPAVNTSLHAISVPEVEDDSNYRPQVADVARRAALFDLPDPSEETSDSFFSDGSSHAYAANVSLANHLSSANEQNYQRMQEQLGTFDESDGLDVPVPVFDDEPAEYEEPYVAEQPKAKRKGFSLFGRKSREEESLSDYLGVEDDYDARTGGREIGSWEELEAEDEEFSRRRKRDPHWKGGAAVSEELRDSDGEIPLDEEAQEVLPTNGIDELLCHDIWFVALGASDFDHAGMKAFIESHRPQLRGAFIINLNCVGAGDLSVLSSESVGNTRKVDRRINRLLKGVAADLSIDLDEVPFNWSSTDATPAMLSSMRAATIMGVNELGLPALSRTADDVPENIDPEQIDLVSRMVTEFIRRS